MTERDIDYRTGPEHYLGDGCFASFDGYQIKLRAPRDHGDDEVYLEPGTFAELLRFARKFWRVEPREHLT